MSAATDADREKAAELLGWDSADIVCARQSDTDDAAVLDAIAAALASEREAALTPVLAECDALNREAKERAERAQQLPKAPSYVTEFNRLVTAAKHQHRAADRIRAAIAAPVAQAGEGR